MTNIEPAPDRPGPDHRAPAGRTPNAVISSPEFRKAVYLGVALVLAGLIVFGVLTEDQVVEWARLAVEFVALGAVLLASVNTPKPPAGPPVT